MAAALSAQSPPAAVLEQRLAELERRQQQLSQEIAELRALLKPPETAPAVPLEERISVQERRTEELAQTRVEAAQRRPIALRGIVLFNAFHAGPNSANRALSTSAVAERRTFAGASLQQTILGLTFHGPEALGARWSGDLEMDFFAGGTSATALEPRFRTASIRAAWKSFDLLAGVEKPLISPHNPSSLAHVGVPLLTDAGNLWIWQPQVRVGYRWAFAERWAGRAQAALVQTNEESGFPLDPAVTFANKRPGLQARASLLAGDAADPWLELGSGAHASHTRVAGASIPSAAWTADWRIRPANAVEWSGLLYRGQNLAHMGALRRGFTLLPGTREVLAVRAAGGWTQFKFRLPHGWQVNAFGGLHDDRDADLRGSGIGRNLTFGGNLQYQIDTNLVAGFETTETRSILLPAGLRRVRRYDLSLAYFF